MNRSLSPATPARISFLSILLLSFLSLAQPALAENENPVHEYELDNGLKVLVKQDKRAPVAVIQVWYRIGTSYEYEGITGLSHALEHMMFKGTKKYKSGEFEKMVSAIGARNNAFTSQDYTAYYEVLANDKLEDAMEIEADRMRNLVFDPAEFKKEIEVVKEERRWRTDDKPSSLTREQFNAVAFLNSPYRAPVIGWMVDLEGMKLKDAKEWYKKWYTPNNATLVVVGDVEPEKVFNMAKKYFSVYASNDLPEVKARTEVAQKGKRNIELKLPAKLASLRMGFKTPGMISAKKGKVPAWEPYALEVLANILDGGDSARFAKNLVRGKEIAASAGAGYYGYGRLDNLLVVSGVPANGVKTSDLKKSLLDEINILKTELVSEAELKRVKAQVIAGEVFERDSIQHMATLLGSLESVGLGHKYIDQYVPGVLAVTAKQIQEVANKYLIEDTLTVAELIPLPLNAAKKSAFKVN
ncbi:pitrilysin family protein [uncultured Cocleimonas sp.]|uniref:M16 family metallopeptidase n=1 Tax=uncultured Cocleimonas sp. TaxID=1051587 RepID=UPI00260D1DF0|nr:pitrilysin family protein [uncultured Cocleimonas sp.]